MKKIIVSLCVLGLGLLLLSATLPPRSVSGPENKAGQRRGGCGYRIIEYGVGINCKGDTVKLSKTKGFQELASPVEVSHSGV